MVTIPLSKGHYEWNIQFNTLEFISDKDFGSESNDKTKRNRGTRGVIHLPNAVQERISPTKLLQGQFSSFSNTNPGLTSHTVGRGTRHRLSPRLGVFRKVHTNITLLDVKAVSLVHLENEVDRTSLSPPFRELFHSNQFNNFLMTLLRYFKCFLEGLEQQKRPHKTSFLEPSKAELKAMRETQRRLSVTKRHLGQTYCILLLGIGLEKQHHMGCGKKRVSFTHRDKKMFEDVYAFCTILVWITFRRREYERIRLELGDMLRSPVYNPASQRSRHSLHDEDSKLPKRYIKDPEKTIAERVEKLLSVKLPEIEKITPAQRRREFGKRPAITKAIHQRSSALVSLLPLPHEESPHLFKSIVRNKKEIDKIQERASSESVLDEDDYYLAEKIGIIGESMEQFNSETLMPKHRDNEEDVYSGDEESVALRSEVSQQSGRELPKVQTLSRATTEDGMRA